MLINDVLFGAKVRGDEKGKYTTYSRFHQCGMFFFFFFVLVSQFFLSTIVVLSEYGNFSVVFLVSTYIEIRIYAVFTRQLGKLIKIL